MALHAKGDPTVSVRTEFRRRLQGGGADVRFVFTNTLVDEGRDVSYRSEGTVRIDDERDVSRVNFRGNVGVFDDFLPLLLRDAVLASCSVLGYP
jgi:hypothetical protein